MGHRDSKWKDRRKFSKQAETERKWVYHTYVRQNRLKPNMGTRDKGYIMIKWSVHQEDVTTVNIYAPNTQAPKC